MKKTTMIATTMSAVLLLAGMASAYHIPTQDADPNHPARQWIAPPGNVPGTVVCESIGLTDPYPLLSVDLSPASSMVVNVNPPVPTQGDGGICYAASQDFYDETAVNDPANPLDDGAWDVDGKKDKKEDDAANQPVWSYVQPVCTLHLDPVTGPTSGPCPAVTDDLKPLLPDWFARVGSNAHSCSGDWDQEFRYKELLAYFHGFAPNDNGVSGHVTFFVLDLEALEGTYHSGKGAEAPPNDMKNNNFCSGSNFVGLSEDLDFTKP